MPGRLCFGEVWAVARVYFVREEISVEVPVETSVLEVEIPGKKKEVKF